MWENILKKLGFFKLSSDYWKKGEGIASIPYIITSIPIGQKREDTLTEDLLMRTSLSLAYEDHYKDINDDEIVYSPNVVVIRKNQKEFYGLLNHSGENRDEVEYQIAVSSTTTPDRTNKKGKVSEQEKELLKQKIFTQLQTAYDKGHTNVIIGEFGQDANIPPEEMAAIYNDVITNYFPNHFERISIAFTGDDTNDASYYQRFAKTFSPGGKAVTFHDDRHPD